MSVLVPDYASSSEDEGAPSVSVTAPLPASTLRLQHVAKALEIPASSSSKAALKLKKTKKKTKKRKTKTTLYLPPEIQRLLETGSSTNALSDDSDDDNELLAKHKRAKKAANKRPRPSEADKDSVLSFLPPPKHELPVSNTVGSAGVAMQGNQGQQQAQDQAQQATRAQADQQPMDEATAAANAAAWQQYYQQQQQYQASYSAASQDFYVAQGEDDVRGGSSKRRRTRERDIERALQQGHFETVADQIREVQGPAPHAWQPPVDPRTGDRGAKGSSDQEIKVNASFWNSQAGTTVSSSKPSRLQRQRHQLNQLAFDAKVRDFELLEKRGASLKTKRETYAKYGW
ncbi:MAD2B-interacting domain-containing protein [Phytophthora infestans]|uniref:MAD2B-interacting domain-containing protein n=1 Tax=Phytophthora infestans TaxID=4787 RepID=A0A8S9UGM1_PHYIN|nr:MAD2B-interacting domain-containing protein [Phytophthora infestans]